MTSAVPLETKFNAYAAITQKIAAAITAGAGRYDMPWHGSGHSIALPVNAVTVDPYRGVNVLSLWIDATAKRYPTGYWASYRQWQKLGAQVRGGEHGTIIVFYKKMEANPDAARDAKTEDGARFVARISRVFNAAQVDGWAGPEPRQGPGIDFNTLAEAFVAATRADIRHGYGMAVYRRQPDCIEMPSREWFVGSATSTATESYYSTLLHELTHWSGAPHRLDRAFGKRFGDRAYAFEELVAELGAAFLCASLGLANEPRPDHAAYVASWLEILGHDHKAIFTAASRAQESVEYLANMAAHAMKSQQDKHQ